jgi:hypothetical protein
METVSAFDFLTNRATMVKALRYWQRDRHKDKWNSLENPEIGSHKYGELIYDKGAKAIQMKEK